MRGDPARRAEIALLASNPVSAARAWSGHRDACTQCRPGLEDYDLGTPMCEDGKDLITAWILSWPGGTRPPG